MQNLSDEDIDKLFKRAAEQQQAQFDPADWDNMASRLDAGKKPRPTYYTGTVSVIVLGVVLWLGWLYFTPSGESSPAVKHTSTSLADKVTTDATRSTTEATVSGEAGTSSPSNNNEHDRSQTSTASSKEETTTRKPSATAALGATTAPLATTTSTIQKQSSSIAEKGEPITSLKSTSLTNQTQTIEPQSIEPPARVTEQRPDDNQTRSSTVQPIQQEQPVTDVVRSGSSSTTSLTNGQGTASTSSPASESNLPVSNSNQSLISPQEEIVTVTVDDPAEATLVEKKDDTLEKTDTANTDNPQSRFSRFAVKASVAPDFSADQFNKVDKMGFNYGAVVEYYITRNFSVSTGAIWSRKYYAANDVEYNGYAADRVYGDCRMWDIPLNITYYLAPQKHTTFFISTGLSSYLMNEENYDYEVETGYGTHTYSMQVKKENNEWFKMLNISIGLQKQLNSRLALQVEPFVKVPLAGVGEGNIALSSFGGFFSMKYSF